MSLRRVSALMMVPFAGLAAALAPLDDLSAEDHKNELTLQVFQEHISRPGRSDLTFNPMPEIFFKSQSLSYARDCRFIMSFDVENKSGGLFDKSSDDIGLKLLDGRVSCAGENWRAGFGKHEIILRGAWSYIFPHGRPSIVAEEASFVHLAMRDQFGLHVGRDFNLNANTQIFTDIYATRFDPVLSEMMFQEVHNAGDDGLTDSATPSVVVHGGVKHEWSDGEVMAGVEVSRLARGKSNDVAEKTLGVRSTLRQGLWRDADLKAVFEYVNISGMGGVRGARGKVYMGYTAIEQKITDDFDVHASIGASEAPGNIKTRSFEFGGRYKTSENCSLYGSVDATRWAGADNDNGIGKQFGTKCVYGF